MVRMSWRIMKHRRKYILRAAFDYVWQLKIAQVPRKALIPLRIGTRLSMVKSENI